jgi:hypothetical protein
MQALLRWRYGATIVACWMCWMSGCQSTGRPWYDSLSLRSRDKAEDTIVTPAMRMTALRQLAYQQETDPLLRMEIIRTLGALPTPESTEVLAAALRDGDREVRITVCRAWAQRGGPEAVQVLSEVLAHDSEIDVRMAAARGLGAMRDPPDEAIAALGRALEDRDPALQHRAVVSLRQVTGRDFGDDVNAWREFVQGGNPPQATIVSRLRRSVF